MLYGALLALGAVGDKKFRGPLKNPPQEQLQIFLRQSAKAPTLISNPPCKE